MLFSHEKVKQEKARRGLVDSSSIPQADKEINQRLSRDYSLTTDLGLLSEMRRAFGLTRSALR